MQINFNELRKKLILDYNQVINLLNGSVCSDVDMDRVVVPVEDLALILERLHLDITTIGIIHDPNIPDCKCIINDEFKVKEFLPNS